MFLSGAGGILPSPGLAAVGLGLFFLVGVSWGPLPAPRDPCSLPPRGTLTTWQWTFSRPAGESLLSGKD